LKELTVEQSYLIKLEKFEGPINLLLDLIRKKKIDIYGIKLSSIIIDFLNYIKKNKDIILDTLSGFLYTASILLEIKSKSLIPSKSETIDEDEEISEDILKRREAEYKVFIKIYNYLIKLYEEENLYYLREAPIEKEFLDAIPDFLNIINLKEINSLASKLLQHKEDRIDLSSIYKEGLSITIFEEMERIKKILEDKDDIMFKDITGNYAKLIDKIICFLSILELYKKEIIDILQFESFGNILIRKAVN
jgi:segregation and condensation protein A